MSWDQKYNEWMKYRNRQGWIIRRRYRNFDDHVFCVWTTHHGFFDRFPRVRTCKLRGLRRFCHRLSSSGATHIRVRKRNHNFYNRKNEYNFQIFIHFFPDDLTAAWRIKSRAERSEEINFENTIIVSCFAFFKFIPKFTSKSIYVPSPCIRRICNFYSFLYMY